MAITRAALVKGPSKIIYTPGAGATTFFSKDDFSIVPSIDRFQIRTAAHGIVDERKLHKYARASIVPDGRFNAALIAALWPHSGSWITPGTSIYDSSADRTLVCHGADSSLATIISAGVRQMPDILFSAKETLVGAVEFGGVLGTGKEWDDASNLFSYAASGGTFTDATFAASLIKTQRYTLGLTDGVTAVDGFQTGIESLDGWRVSFQQNLKSWEPDGLGLIDETLTDLVVTVTGIPIGPTALQLVTALRLTSDARGASFATGGGALTITGEDAVVYLTIPSSNVFAGGIGYGNQILRNGEVQFVAMPTYSSGVPQALFTLAAS